MKRGMKVPLFYSITYKKLNVSKNQSKFDKI